MKVCLQKFFRVGNYMLRQAFVTREMRAVLADWMVEVQENFELNHETLYLAVKLVDLYLDRTRDVAKDDLQLIASTAIFIASKFDVSGTRFLFNSSFMLNLTNASTEFVLIFRSANRHSLTISSTSARIRMGRRS